jgi:hypothetical protein
LIVAAVKITHGTRQHIFSDECYNTEEALKDLLKKLQVVLGGLHNEEYMKRVMSRNQIVTFADYETGREPREPGRALSLRRQLKQGGDKAGETGEKKPGRLLKILSVSIHCRVSKEADSKRKIWSTRAQHRATMSS